MSNHVTNWDKVNQESNTVNESLSTELERYKERVKTFEQRLNIDLSNREKLIDSQMDDMIQNRNEEVVPNVDDVSLVDKVFDGAFGGDGEEDFVMGEGVVVSSSSLVRSTKSCLGGMIVSLIFLEGLEDEAWVGAMGVEVE
ncbi:hypothetical protein Tco_0869549 [Tanacetum coccineum]